MDSVLQIGNHCLLCSAHNRIANKEFVNTTFTNIDTQYSIIL